jgi:hypothetical protein
MEEKEKRKKKRRSPLNPPKGDFSLCVFKILIICMVYCAGLINDFKPYDPNHFQ